MPTYAEFPGISGGNGGLRARSASRRAAATSAVFQVRAAQLSKTAEKTGEIRVFRISAWSLDRLCASTMQRFEQCE